MTTWCGGRTDSALPPALREVSKIEPVCAIKASQTVIPTSARGVKRPASTLPHFSVPTACLRVRPGRQHGYTAFEARHSFWQTLQPFPPDQLIPPVAIRAVLRRSAHHRPWRPHASADEPPIGAPL